MIDIFEKATFKMNLGHCFVDMCVTYLLDCLANRHAQQAASLNCPHSYLHKYTDRTSG